MVNITQGSLQPDGTGNPNGTDLIYTPNDSTTPLAVYAGSDIGWVMVCTCLVWLMIPGLGYLYAGLLRRKNALHMLLMTLSILAVISFQWFFWGFSLAFSPTSGKFFGNLNHFGHMNVDAQPAPVAMMKLPLIVFSTYQLTFAALVPSILIGAAAERGRVAPALVFVFCWSTLVFDIFAAWLWNPNGWAYQFGILDYAGGVPVEIASGVGGLVYSWYLGKRRGYGTERLAFKPHNISSVVLGTVFLWVGWLGFNGGSDYAASVRAAMALTATNLSASMGALTWMFMDYRYERSFSVVGFCTGAITGLVAITPAAGYVGLPASVLIGVLSSALANLATGLKAYIHIDDAADIFAIHALAGAIGLFLTGIFAQASVANNNPLLVIDGGWLDHNYVQLPKQMLWIVIGIGWTAVITIILMFIIDHIPGLHFRVCEEAEILGVDEDQLGEWAYDFVGINRDLEGNYDEKEIERITNGGTDISEKKGNDSLTSSDTAGSDQARHNGGQNMTSSKNHLGHSVGLQPTGPSHDSMGPNERAAAEREHSLMSGATNARQQGEEKAVQKSGGHDEGRDDVRDPVTRAEDAHADKAGS